MSITIDGLVAIDQKMGVALKKLEDEVTDIETQREEVRDAIMKLMNEQEVESVRTAHGTVTRTIRERYWTGDWTALHQYILDNGALGLLEKRVQHTNMKEWVAEHPDDYPPGLNIDRAYTLSIRKPKKGVSNVDAE